MYSKYSLTIGWLYPDLMSTYGDRGNVLVLAKRLKWRGIKAIIQPIQQETTLKEMKEVDFIFGGGSQDLQQELVMRDLMGKKGEAIKELIEKNVPALFVCGSPQLMGKYYEPAVGKRIEGLGVFDMESLNPGPDKPRCIGNIIGEVQWQNIVGEHESMPSFVKDKTIIVGFENHGGRTYLGKNVKSFAKVLHGYGNNGEDKTEGVVYKNAIGCYFHGPLLPKNPEIADYLLETALKVKYKEHIALAELDNQLEQEAKHVIMNRYNI